MHDGRCSFESFAVLLLSLQIAHPSVEPCGQPTVQLPGLGTLTGICSDHYPTIQRYFGIPFAKPPVGSLRWAPPQPHGPFEALDATTPGAVCLQPDANAHFDANDTARPELANLTMNEDCLTLNVAVAGYRKGGLPVMVWVHGGGYMVGAGANYRNDALVNASSGAVIVVTFNYRLGVFGFLGSSELAARGADGSTGNYGMADQRLALQWVHQNIAAFGGKPDSISLFGESSGGNGILAHLVQPRSYPLLFKRAIIQSGTYAGSVDMATAEQTYQVVLRNSKCLDLDCLLNADALTVATAFPEGSSAGPVVDGVVLTAEPHDLIAAGEYNKHVHVVLGHNREEMAWGICPPSQHPSDFSESQLDAYLGSTFAGLNTSSISRVKLLYSNRSFQYPIVRGNQSFWWWEAAASLSDVGWGLGHCSVRRLARMLVAGGSPVVYAYEFKHPAQGDATDGTYGWSLADAGFSVPGNTACPHGSEVVFSFGAVHAVPAGEAAELAASMGELWTNFAATGIPGAMWPSYAQSNDTFLVLDVSSAGGMRPQHGAEAEQCAFFDSLLEQGELHRPPEQLWDA